MVNTYTIECYQKINNVDVPILDGEEIVLENNGRYDNTFYVKCDGVDDNNSFILSYNGDDEIVVNRNRCELDVYIKPNLTPHEKTFFIKCTNVYDSEVSVTFTLTQPADFYNIDIDNSILNLPLDYVSDIDSDNIITQEQYNNLENEEKQNYRKRYTLTLKSEITECFTENLSENSNYNYYEEKKLNILVQGGNKNYKIKALHKQIIDEDQVFRKKFDNGFVYVLNREEYLIRNYGKPFLENGYYELVLCHNDAKEFYVIFKIIYDNIQTSRRLTSKKTDKRYSLNNKKTPTHKIYPSANKLANMIENSQNVDEIIKTYTYDIVFDKDINDEIVILDNNINKSLTFKVLENNTESNLMVDCQSSARWCKTILDETNRILTIKITDKPISERRSLIKLWITSYPEIFKTFVILNKPS